jgi:preprotein translocase subunit SecB
MQANENTQGKNEKAAAAKFSLQKIYIKDLSFESPRAVESLLKPMEQSNVNFQLNAENRKLEDSVYEVVLTVTVTVSKDNATLYLVEVKQAGLFVLNSFPEDELTLMLNVFCPSILYPYAREAVSSMAERGGFPQLLLKPVNFDAIYHQYIKNGPKAAAPAAS